MKKKDKPLAWEWHSKAITPPRMQGELVSNRRGYIKLRRTKTCSDLLFYQQVLKKYQQRKKNRFWLPVMIYFHRAAESPFQKFYQHILFQLFFYDKKMSPSLVTKVLKDREYNVERIKINNIFYQLSLLPILLYNNLPLQEKMHHVQYSSRSQFSSVHNIATNPIKSIHFKRLTHLFSELPILLYNMGFQDKIHHIQYSRHSPFSSAHNIAMNSIKSNFFKQTTLLLSMTPIMLYNSLGFQDKINYVQSSRGSRFSSAHNIAMNSMKSISFKQTALLITKNIINKIIKGLQVLSSSNAAKSIQKLLQLRETCTNYMIEHDKHLFVIQGEEAETEFTDNQQQRVIENKHILNHHTYNYKPETTVPISGTRRSSESGNGRYLYFHLDAIKKNTLAKGVPSMGENLISRLMKVLQVLSSSNATINIQRFFPFWRTSNNDMFIKEVHSFFSRGEWPDRQFINDRYQSTVKNKYILNHHKYSFGSKRSVPYLAENRTVESRSTGHLNFQNFRRLEEDIEEIKKNMIKTEGQLSERLNSLHTITPSSVPEIEKRLDIQSISNRVYKEIEQRIKIERERRGL